MRSPLGVCDFGAVIFLQLWLCCSFDEASFDPAALSPSSFSTSPRAGTVCLDPGGLKNGRRQPEFKYKALLPQGAQLHFSCWPGYILEGSGKMVCGSRGTWEPPTKPSCRPVVCPEPHFENGQIRASKVGSYFPGTTVQVVCDDGYRLKDAYANMIECHLDGEWVGHNGEFTVEMPECIEHTCSAPPQLPNSQFSVHGDIGWDGGYLPRSVTTYQCNYGYQFEDIQGSRLVCQNGHWQQEHSDVPLSKCVQGGCSRPLPITSGNFVPEMTGIYPYDQVVTYYCYMGYTLAGPYTFHCLPDGRWSPKMRSASLPVCQRHLATGCPEPTYISHGRIDKINGSGPSANNYYAEDTVVSYACDEGFRLQDCKTSWIICKDDRWVNSIPACVELNGCGKPPTVSFAIVMRHDLTSVSASDAQYPLYTKVHYKCRPGFQLLGTPDLICAVGGCWTPNVPQCVPLDQPYDEWSLSPFSPPPPDSSEVDSGSPSWSNTDVITIFAACVGSLIGGLLLVQVIVFCRRRRWNSCLHHRHRHQREHHGYNHPAGGGQPLSPSSSGASSPCGPPPQCDPDRVALIAFADGMQVVLPTYEEAMRQPRFEAVAGTHRGRWGRGTLPSLPPTTRRTRGQHPPPPTRDPSTDSGNNTHPGPPTRQSSSSHSGGDSMGSTDTVATSEVSTTVTLDTLSSTTSYTSQPVSCRAICGSLASIDTCSVLNTDGVPLLEETLEENTEADAKVEHLPPSSQEQQEHQEGGEAGEEDEEEEETDEDIHSTFSVRL